MRILTIIHEAPDMDATEIEFKGRDASDKIEILCQLRIWLRELPRNVAVKSSIGLNHYVLLNWLPTRKEYEVLIRTPDRKTQTFTFKARKKAEDVFVNTVSQDGAQWSVSDSESLLLDPKKLKKLLVEWHITESTDRAEANEYAVRLIERMKKECKV